MASEMVEKVARAIAVANGHNPDATNACRVDGKTVTIWQAYVADARAAIAAMREPTGAMEQAGSGYLYWANVYDAMIDAALKED